MKTFQEIKKILEEKKEFLKTNFKIKEIGIFGSCVYNEQEESSDVDILVDYCDDNISLFDVLELKFYLEELLGKPVDIVTKEALKPVIGKYILNEVIYI